ncbi:hypothetical protein OCS_03429 [Ophiocordyceps sinensis CO18]|nr:hypothetical protein OCS_03429 [Ophiocordyceps sinensis CO18]
MGHDEAGRRLVNEANEVYYGENEFHVRLRHLFDFLQNTGGDVDPSVAIPPLVRKKVTIEVELHDIWHSSEVLADFGSAQDAKSDYHDEENGEIARWTRGRLRNVALLTNAESILVVLLGVGVVDGSDLGTHQTIKDIASVVRALIGQFGGRFDITKVLTRGQGLGGSIRSYWDRPSAEARVCVFNGWATTEQLMQVEIARWLDEDVREPGPDGLWDRLV